MSYDGSSGTSVWREAYQPPVWATESTPPASTLLPAAWLWDLWTDAQRRAREAVWEALPDRIGDAAEATPVTRADIAFLRDRTADRTLALPSAAAALRTLGRLCEDQPQWLSEAMPALLNGLSHAIATMRYAAAEAIWQSRALAALPAVQDALVQESEPTVRETLQHVLRILR